MPTLTQRSQKWDILKFFMIFLVVLGHVAEFFTAESQGMRNLFTIIYTVHMPIFIFVAGLFSKKTVNEKRYDRIFGFLVLYFARKLLPYLYTFSGAKAVGVNLFSESGVSWFMLAVFAFNLMTVALKNFSPAFISVFAVIIACAAGYDANVNDFLALSRIIIFYPFFWLGYCTDRVKLEKICDNKKFKFAAATVIIIFVATVVILGDGIYALKPLLTGRRAYPFIKNAPKWGFLFRLGYYAVASLISFAVIVLTPNKTPKGIVAKLGQRTLAVYVFHYFAIHILFNVFDMKTVLSTPDASGKIWLIVPLSLIITLIFSLGIFDKAVQFLLNVPKRKTAEISS